MSPLDDARNLLSAVGEDGPRDHRDYPYSQSWCALCGEAEAGAPHSATCPWLSMPKIVAALEAAERLVTSASRKPGVILVQVDGFLMNDLVAALAGEGVRA